MLLVVGLTLSVTCIIRENNNNIFFIVYDFNYAHS